MIKIKKLFQAASLGVAVSILSVTAHAEVWSATEVNLQSGELDRPDGGTADTSIITLQHAGGWEYGDNFFFIDYLIYNENNNNNRTAINSSEVYGEWYSNFSLGQITGNEIKFGPVKDIGIIMGLNFAPEVNSYWVLPGVRFALDLPGFARANLDVTAYMYQGGGGKGSTPADPFMIVDEGNSYMIDFNWAYPFEIGGTKWSLEGHIEYIDGRTQVNNFGTTELASWVLAQPQLRFDVSDALGGKPGRIYAGIEYQYWKNKLGNKNIDESVAQLLLVWQF